MSLSDSISIHSGTLKLYNIYKLQVKAIYEYQHKNQVEFRKAVLEKTYFPFQQFWAGYVGDSNVYFDQIIIPLLNDSMYLFESRAVLYADGGIDHYFTSMAAQMKTAAGYYPTGKWYLVFGSGVTDMGGFGGGEMVLDLVHPKTSPDYVKFILPHEMSHQIFDFTNREDTAATALYRIINEGLAVYMNEKMLGSRYKLNEYLQFSEDELSFCLRNESMIFTKLRPFLFTGNADHAKALTDRGQKVFKDGPGAIGYFLGYRICEQYVKKNGSDSWRDIFSIPVRDVLENSGYNP